MTQSSRGLNAGRLIPGNTIEYKGDFFLHLIKMVDRSSDGETLRMPKMADLPVGRKRDQSIETCAPFAITTLAPRARSRQKRSRMIVEKTIVDRVPRHVTKR
jgi:hypothetical protein